MARFARLVGGIVLAWGLVLAPAAIAQQGDAAGRLFALGQRDPALREALREKALVLKRELALREKALGPDHPAVAGSLNNLAWLYKAQGRYADAEPLLKRALAISEKALGPDAVAGSLSNLAALYRAQGRYADAEPLYKRALALREKALGPDHAEVGTSLNNLAALYHAQGRYADAEPLYKRALALREKALGPDHPAVGTSLNNLAALYHAQGRYADAEPLLKRALAISEKAFGPDDPADDAAVGASLNNLAELYRDQGRYADAEPLYKRALALREKALGPDHPAVGTSLNNLAELYHAQGRYADAEPLLKRALAIWEKALGPDHPDVGASLNNLAWLYRDQGRYADAEPLYKRALALREKALGPDHPAVAGSLNNLAALYHDQGRYADAEPLYKRALAIWEKALGPDHPAVGTSLNNLAALYKAQGRYADAEPLLKRALAIWEKALGPDHPAVGTSLNNLAWLYRDQGRYADAEPLYKRALALREKALGPDHPDVGASLNNLARLHFAQSDWTRAADYLRRGTSVIVHRVERGTAVVGKALTGEGKSEAEQRNLEFWVLLKATYRLRLAAEKGSASADASLVGEMFQTAQWAQGSEAAAALAQMAARGVKGDPALAAIVRERQDLVAEWQKRDSARSAAVSQSPEKRDKVGEAANGARMNEIDARITEIDKRLAQDFPDYAALASPKPLSVEQVQAALAADEALVLFFDTDDRFKPTPEETFIWVVTKTDALWVRSELGTPSLKREVAALRCGLDRDGSWGAPGSSCAELLKIAYSDTDYTTGKLPLPFDINRAHELYKALFGQIEGVIKDKRLLIVPSGALTQLPFQVLVTEKPDPPLTGLDAFRHAAWLVRGHALTVLPSVSSLKALRELAKASRASRALIGFGNPLLAGQPDKYPDDGPRAVRARANQSCPKPVVQQVASLEGGPRGMPPLTLRGGLADVAQIRFQAPLPETADELCAVARDLGAGADDVRLGAHATETEIKRLSDTGDLAKYRTIHFATHGALAGQVSGDSEPGLLLTPPDQASATDDGYLSASEIAALKLDADWVILSACNTAAGGADGADALSGLARAFFYGGARALLVSHWSVDSGATVKLITGAISTMAADKSIGRAEAMRRSMLAMIDKGAPYEAHPAYWAPFIVVGEGGATSMPEVAAPITGAIGAPSATSAKPNSEAPAPNAEAVAAPVAPVTGRAPAGTTQPLSETSSPSTDNQASSVKKGATKKARRKPKSDDWITSIFGQ